MVPTYGDHVYHTLAGFLITVSILGLILNLLVIIVFIKLYKRDYKFLNLMIASTAVSDVLPSVCSYPLTAYRTHQKRGYPFNSIECSFEGFCIQLAALVSVSHLALMAYERYMVITSGISRVLSPKWHLAITASVWLYGILVSSMPLLGWSSYQPEGLETSCTVHWTSRNTLDISFNAILLLADFLVPLVVICYSYTRLWLFTRHNGLKKRWVDSSVNIQRWKVRRRNNRTLTLMVLIMVLMFLGAWAPYVVVSLWSFVNASSDISPLAATIPSVFAKSFTLLNPIVYGIKHYKFRKELRNGLFNIIGCHQRRSTFTSSTNSSGTRFDFTTSESRRSATSSRKFESVKEEIEILPLEEEKEEDKPESKQQT